MPKECTVFTNIATSSTEVACCLLATGRQSQQQNVNMTLC